MLPGGRFTNSLKKDFICSDLIITIIKEYVRKRIVNKCVSSLHTVYLYGNNYIIVAHDWSWSNHNNWLFKESLLLKDLLIDGICEQCKMYSYNSS